MKYQSVIYPEGIPIRFQIYYSKIDRLEIVYYCAKKKRCSYSQLVTLFPANTGKKAEVCEINPPHRCPKHTKSSIIDGTNQNKLELESEIQNFIQVNPIVSLSQVIAFANQLVLEYNESHDDIIEISSDVIRRLYQEIKPKMKMNEDELIKKLLEHYNNQNFYITKIYSNIDDSKFYFFGLPLFINRARTLKHLFIDGTFKVVPINLSNGQLLNFLVFDNATNLYLPFLHVLMTGRSADDYNTVFNMMLTHEQIKIGLNQFSIITTDFEAALMNSIKEKISKETVLTGCIFHYIAALVKNFKKLCNQDDHASKSLLKLLCGCPFVPNSVFKLICSKLELIKDTSKFAAYFLRTWKYKYEEINKMNVKDMIFSNNGVESFNKVLNSHIIYPHPTIFHMIYTLLQVDTVIAHRYLTNQRNQYDHKKSYYISLTKINEELFTFERNFNLEISEIPKEEIDKYKNQFHPGDIDYRDIEIEKFMNRNDSEINDSIKINLENDEDGKITEFTLNESDVFN